MLARCFALCALTLSVGCADVSTDDDSVPDSEATMMGDSSSVADPSGHPDLQAAASDEDCEDEDCEDASAAPADPAQLERAHAAAARYLSTRFRVNPQVLSAALRGPTLLPALPVGVRVPGPTPLPHPELAH